MYASFVTGSKIQFAALSGAIAFALVAGSAQAQISQSAERKNINRLGHTDLQGRSSYQPNVIQYPDGRWIMFAGMHSTIPVPAGGCPAGEGPRRDEATCGESTRERNDGSFGGERSEKLFDHNLLLTSSMS